MPPASTKPSAPAPAAAIGSFPRSRALMFVTSPSPARSSSTAPASCSRSTAISRRTSDGFRELVRAISQSLLRALRLFERLFRYRRRAALERLEADESEDAGKHEQAGKDEQQGQPGIEDDREGHGRRSQAEAHREQGDDTCGDGKPSSQAERRGLALQLEAGQLDLESRQSAR